MEIAVRRHFKMKTCVCVKETSRGEKIEGERRGESAGGGHIMTPEKLSKWQSATMGRHRTEQSHLGVDSGGCSVATLLPLLLVPGTCLECRAAVPPPPPNRLLPVSVARGPKSVSYEAQRRARALSHRSPPLSLSSHGQQRRPICSP